MIPFTDVKPEPETPVLDMLELDRASDYAMAAWRAKRALDRRSRRRGQS